MSHATQSLRCDEVLARLSDYVDGDVTADERAALETHLRGCDACTRFGGEFAATLRALRRHLLADEQPPPTLRERLRRAIAAEPTGE